MPPYFVKMMKECWDEEPGVRPSFVLLTETLEKIICPEPHFKKPRRRKRRVKEEEEGEGILSPEMLLSEEEKGMAEGGEGEGGEEDRLLSPDFLLSDDEKRNSLL
jgi:hypothetical protein